MRCSKCKTYIKLKHQTITDQCIYCLALTMHTTKRFVERFLAA